MAQESGFIKYVAIIGVILVAVFLSQQSNIKEWVKGSTAETTDPTRKYLENGASWVKDNALSAISGEVQKRGEMVQEGINQEKEKISQSVTEKIKNYFDGVSNSILHPGQPQNCPPPVQ